VELWKATPGPDRRGDWDYYSTVLWDEDHMHGAAQEQQFLCSNCNPDPFVSGPLQLLQRDPGPVKE
jgi:hypothetical protein